MLILIAPSQTETEQENVWLGTGNSRLSTVGRAVAKDLANIDPIDNDRAYVGPADHVVEFASIVLMNCYEITVPFIDRSMGSLTGRSYRETLAEFPRRNWLAWQRSYWTAPPEGESLFDISDRVITTLRTRVLPVTAAETVVIVGAADILRILIGYLTKSEEEAIPRLSIQPAIPYVFNGELTP